tara:strand:+ start:251 stop:760 length:510 start_codon:yes stop_codon:yes gene_type:complete
MRAEENFENLCNLATSLLGMDKGALTYKSRKQYFQVPRAVVSVIARMEDKTHREVIAKVLKRDRTSVNHYERTHLANYASFPLYRDTFNQIYNAYVDLKNSKKKFADIHQFKDFLRENDIDDSSNHQTTIRIRSGRFTVAVNVSYRDFYNKLELCKLALQDYQHEIEII